jgi:hypothetical protein
MNEKEKIEHQIELATRVAALVKDESTVERFKSFAEELKQKLLSMMRRPQVRARAYELGRRRESLLTVIWSFGSKRSGG